MGSQILSLARHVGELLQVVCCGSAPGCSDRVAAPMPGCWICTKHQAMTVVPGGEVLSDDEVVVSHLPLTTPTSCSPSVYLGHLFVEPRRHVVELGDLTSQEASSMGRLASAASSALRRSEGAEHVYAAVVGDSVEHLHLHLIPRYPGTPREFWWTRVDEWPGAPRGDAADVIALAERLRRALR
jgi:histidine triad (HIT) family protein